MELEQFGNSIIRYEHKKGPSKWTTLKKTLLKQ